jgi:hypothetical protein
MGMAKRKYSKKSNKIEPSVQTISLITPSVTGGTFGSFYCDLSQIACLLNRRFYRQGINWAVSGIKILTTGTGTVQVEKLPNTWVMSNAWEKGMRAWNKLNREALAENPSLRPKFLDFKIYADAGHHQAGYGANLLPYNAQLPPLPFTDGEWEPSKIIYPTTVGGAPGVASAEMEIVAVGANYPGGGASGLNALSLIEGYAASRGLPNVLDPNTPTDADAATGTFPQNWIAAMFNDGTDQTADVIDDMTSENNIAPYPFENDGVHVDTMYPGGANQGTGMQLHDLEFITGTTIGGTTRMKGGNFPCGLMKFTYVPNETTNLRIQIDLVPGNHRGYLCEPMTEM